MVAGKGPNEKPSDRTLVLVIVAMTAGHPREGTGREGPEGNPRGGLASVVDSLRRRLSGTRAMAPGHLRSEPGWTRVD